MPVSTHAVPRSFAPLFRRFATPHSLAAVASLALTSAAWAQAIGPDIISSSHNDVARNGANAAGTIIAYSIGSLTCNHGDMPAEVQPNISIRPLVAQEMFRLKSYSSNAGTLPFQRFESIGQGWAKWVAVPGGGSYPSCGTCQITANLLGVNCADLYSSAFNAPSSMAARSLINAATGMLNGARGGATGEAAIASRIQVLTADVSNQPPGTRFFVETVHLLPHDAQYVRPGASIAVNALNNASSQEININNGASNPTLIGGLANQQIPALARWREIDPDVTLVTADHDDTPNPRTPGAFIRCRFYVAAKVTNLTGTPAGPWRYEYAVYNLNSDRSAGAFSIPFPAAADFSEYTFHSAPLHSGEAISNAPWTAQKTPGNALEFATSSFNANPSANAIRWGTLVNFGFTAPMPPALGSGLITLFKPGAQPTIPVANLPVPIVPPVCQADFNHDGSVDPDDLGDFINCYFALPPCLDADFNADGSLDPDDLGDFINLFFSPC